MWKNPIYIALSDEERLEAVTIRNRDGNTGLSYVKGSPQEEAGASIPSPQARPRLGLLSLRAELVCMTQLAGEFCCE
jgi:hypothetical protein